MSWLVFVLLAVVALALLATYLGSSFILYDPDRRPHEHTPAKFGLAYEDVEFHNGHGHALKGWLVPGRKDRAGKGTILLCHGWGANKAWILESTRFLAEAGWDLFYFDTRGCGESGGRQATIGYLETFDLDAAISFLRRRRPEALERLGIWGRSMGGAMSLTAAARHPEIRAVVAEAPFASYNEVISRWNRGRTPVPDFPLIPMTRAWIRLRLGADPEPFSPLYHVHRLEKTPVLYITGDRDWLMPVSESERLHRRTPGEKELWIVPGADHDGCWDTAPDEYARRVLAFYDKHVAARPAEAAR